MAKTKISNALFNTTSTIPISDGATDTFNISNIYETDEILETGSDTMSIVLTNDSQIERMIITATGGVATIVKRGLKNDDTETEDTNLKKQWDEGTLVFNAPLAFDLPGLEDDNTWSGDQTFTGDITKSAGKTTYTSTTETQDVAQNVTETERDALTGVEDGARIYNTTSGQTEWREGGAWVPNDSGGSVPNASETVAGKGQVSTQAKFDTGDDLGSTGAPNIPKNSQIKAKNDAQDTAVTNLTTKVNNESILGDGSDGVLNISSGTTNLAPDTVYNYSEVNISPGATLGLSGNGNLLLKCSGTFTNNGTIDVSGLGEGAGDIVSQVLTVTVAAGTGGTAGAGGVDGFGGIAGVAGTGGSDGYGGGGGGGSGGSSGGQGDGGDGGNGGNPGGTGGTGSSGPGNGNNGGISAGGSGGGQGNSGTTGAGGDAYENDGNVPTAGFRAGMGGGGAAGGVPGANILIFTNEWAGNGTVISNGTDGGDGGDGKAVSDLASEYRGAGGGGGGGGAGGGVTIILVTNSYTGSYDTTGGVGGIGGLGKTANNGPQTNRPASDGNAGSNGGAGPQNVIELNSFI